MKTREELLTLIPLCSIGAEIGVFQGDFSHKILKQTRPDILFLVDVFTGKMTSGDKNGENLKEISLDESYDHLTSRYLWEPSVKLYKGYSSSFFNSIPYGMLDFVYIDGDHSYEGCKADLEAACKKVKVGGIIAGHDYCERFDGVMRAVFEVTHSIGARFQTTTDDKCASYIFTNK